MLERAHAAQTEQYERRPWVDEELWAAKVVRVLEQVPDGLGEDELLAATGLSVEQLDAQTPPE